MPGAQDLLKLSLISKRRDIINFTEAICSDDIKLTIASDFSCVSFSDLTLILVDASLFNDFDLGILECGEKIAAFSICVLPPNLPEALLKYVERNFKYIISYPINREYFRSYCRRTRMIFSKMGKEYGISELNLKPIPESLDGYFYGASTVIKSVRSQILTASYTKDPVLILGETGVGKTTAASVIHTLSDRHDKEMITVDPSALAGTLSESAFFGHIRGSYTDAAYERHGYFEEANGSTLFFDEFGIASLTVQAILLPVLETGNYMQIGDNRKRHTDVRMIFATNANLEKMLNAGSFRRDLYFRICDNVIRIPPLRKHKEDIREMVFRHLGNEIQISEQALELLEDYDWPGNIRELHKCLNRACSYGTNRKITADLIDLGAINIPK